MPDKRASSPCDGRVTVLLLKSVSFSLALSALLYGMTSAPAYAYLDPGTGSMILQLLLGGIAGLALAGKFYWHRLLTLVGLRSEATETGPGEAQGNDLNSRIDR
jgi:hypothetical protein